MSLFSSNFNGTGGATPPGRTRRLSVLLAYAQLSRAATFWPHFMPLVKHSQMFPPPE